MVKKCFQVIGLISLFLFSFYYTEKVITVVKNKDPLMMKIKDYSENYRVSAVNATVKEDNVIPGINGCAIDENKSYNNMRRIGDFNSNMIEYKEIKPKLSLEEVYDKYIIKGKKDKNEVAIIFKVNKNSNIKEIVTMLKEKKIKSSFFLDGKYIEENNKEMYNMIKEGHEIYNLGYDSKYDEDLIMWTNSMIENVSNNKSNYCLVLENNSKILDLCAKNKMHTIKPELVINYSNTLALVKDKIEKGSIILFDINNNTITELLATINFLNKKGFQYNLLSEHLSEKRCQ